MKFGFYTFGPFIQGEKRGIMVSIIVIQKTVREQVPMGWSTSPYGLDLTRIYSILLFL